MATGTAALNANIQAGEFRRYITLQVASAPTDADTNADTDAGITWTNFANLWAAVEPQQGTAIGAPNANLEGVVTYLVRTRYIPGVLPGMQIYEAATSLYLDILAVIDVNEQHRVLHLSAVSRLYPPV